MEADHRIVKVAVNPKIVDKRPLNGDERYFAEGWENIDLPVEDFATCIKNGWAYCPQLDGRRSSKNFRCSNIVSVDIDEGMTIEEAMELPFVKNHLSLFYTTSSHTSAHHKFRLIFILPRDVIDPIEQTVLNRALTKMFGGDQSTVDASRIFYGSSESEPLIFDRQIDTETLEQLLDLGKQAGSDSSGRNFISSRRSGIRLDPTTEVVTSSGSVVQVGEVKEHTRILCPFHHDKSSSAFIDISDRGSTYLHCVVCKTTHWMDGKIAKSQDEDQPLDFVETCRAIARNENIATESTLSEFQTSDGNKVSISFLNNKYFELPSIPEGITFIKSPKGSGKTTSLLDAMRPVLTKSRFLSLSDYEEADDDDPPVIYSDYSVLLIGHRQALIRDLCNRLQLNCYLDDNKEVKTYGNARKQRYGVCLDSLWKVRDYKYDLVIIDEVEQVLSHFLADTLQNREIVFKIMEAIVASARSVIALDADLDWVALRTLTGMQRRHIRAGCLSGDIQIFINEYCPSNQKIKIYQSKNQLLGELLDDIREGKRCFISSNSKKLVKKIEDIIGETFDSDKACICITSDNSHNDGMQHFVNNIKQEAKKYDVILSSPSLGTGVDITFDDDEVAIDVVYGFYETLINTHTDIDQQLGRVRHPGQIKVWISHRQFEFETNFEVMIYDLLTENFVSAATLSIDPITREEIYDTGNPFLRMAAEITSVQRRSKNKLRKNFIDYKSRHRWEIEVVDKDDYQITEGKAAFDQATNRLLERHADDLMDSPPLKQDDYYELRDRIEDNESLSTAEHLSLTRTSIEYFYSQPISKELIELDRQHGFRRAVRIYELLTSTQPIQSGFPEYTKFPHPDNKLRLKIFNDFQGAVYLLEGLLKTLPFYKDHHFDVSVEYTAGDLTKFIANCKNYKAYVEGLFGEDVRSDIDKNPTQQLGRILNIVGLRQTRTRSQKIAGVKIYYYRLDESSIATMNNLVHHRKLHRSDPWEYVHQLHNFDHPNASWEDANSRDLDRKSLQLAFELRESHRPPFPRINTAVGG